MRVLAVCLALLSGPALAAPEQSLRPVPRAGAAEGSTQPVALSPSGTIPAARRADGVVPGTVPGAAAQAEPTRNGLFRSLRPLFRSRKLEQQARSQRALLRQGAVCGDIAIQGRLIGAVPGRISGCGIKQGVRVRSVSGVTLSQEATIDCTTAKALKTWLDETAKPAMSRKGGGLARLQVAAHYACRTRNNQPGGKISEHGRGRAIDISGFTLRDGTKVTVLNGWNKRGTSRALKKLHKGACGPFGTVLGPNADRFHQDHFHFDTARYRSGTYCR